MLFSLLSKRKRKTVEINEMKKRQLRIEGAFSIIYKRLTVRHWDKPGGTHLCSYPYFSLGYRASSFLARPFRSPVRPSLHWPTTNISISFAPTQLIVTQKIVEDMLFFSFLSFFLALLSHSLHRTNPYKTWKLFLMRLSFFVCLINTFVYNLFIYYFFFHNQL